MLTRSVPIVGILDSIVVGVVEGVVEHRGVEPSLPAIYSFSTGLYTS